jgi:hypothetical protein
MEWTSLISATDFTGLRADVLSTAGGIISILLIVVGIGIIYKVLT